MSAEIEEREESVDAEPDDPLPLVPKGRNPTYLEGLIVIYTMD